jgi:hypothetical protein
MSVEYLNNEYAMVETTAWSGVIEVTSVRNGWNTELVEFDVLVDMESIVTFVEKLNKFTTKLDFKYQRWSSGAVYEMPSLERFDKLDEVTFTDFCDLTAVPKVAATCKPRNGCMLYSLVLTKDGCGMYKTFPTGDWNTLVIRNLHIERLHWPSHVFNLWLTNCFIDNVYPPDGALARDMDGSLITTNCTFTDLFYEEMWNNLPTSELWGKNIYSISTFDHLVSLDNFVLMRQGTLRHFNRLTVEVGGEVNVIDGDGSKIKSAAALANNVLRMAVQFVYF